MGTDGGHHMLGGLQAFGCKSLEGTQPEAIRAI